MKKIGTITDKTLGIGNLISNSPFCFSARSILIKSNTMAISHEKLTNLYSTIGGSMELNETPLATIKREIFEETGYLCTLFKPLGYIIENRGSLNYQKKTYYFVTIINESTLYDSPQLTQAEIDVQQEILWYPIQLAYSIISKPLYSSIQYKFIQKRDCIAVQHFLKYFYTSLF